MRSSLLPARRRHASGIYLTPVLAACLLSAGCSVFRHDQQPTAGELLDKPITHDRHMQAVEESKPSWLQSMFGTSTPPKPKMEDWIGQPKPTM